MNTLTVEDALAELRELLAPHMVNVYLRIGATTPYEDVAEVSIPHHCWAAPTFPECLANIRKWKESQQS